MRPPFYTHCHMKTHVFRTFQTTGCPLTLTFHAFRQRVLFVAPPRGGECSPHPTAAPDHPPLRFDVTHTMAGVHGADVLVLVLDVSRGVDAAVDAEGDLALTCIRAVGVPTVIAVVQGLGALPAAKAADARRWVGRLFATEFGEDVRIVEADVPPAAAAPGPAAADEAWAAALVASATASGAALRLTRIVCRCGGGRRSRRGVAGGARVASTGGSGAWVAPQLLSRP